ncbi:MAG: ABC transporter permease [Acidobacteriota bacterium]
MKATTGLIAFTFRRTLLAVPTLILITMLIFAVMKLAPGNPFSALRAGRQRATEAMPHSDYQSMLHRYGLDRPWYLQYESWLSTLLHGSLGISFSEHRPVLDILKERLPYTLLLNGLALLFAVATAFPAGLIGALRKGGRFDRWSGVLLYGLYSVPAYWLAVLLIIAFGVKLGWLPFYGAHSVVESAGLRGVFDVLKHAILPAITLGVGAAAFLSRFFRSSLLEALGADHVRTARAKGLSPVKLFTRHIFRPSLVPLITLAGLLVPELVAGSVVIEPIFAWPGIGTLYLHAIYSRDYPVIMSVALLGAVMVLAGTLAADLGCAVADPRLRS